ncbi:MAG: hypothetical protein ACOC00_05665 [Halothiobacillaceae bacterium]
MSDQVITTITAAGIGFALIVGTSLIGLTGIDDLDAEQAKYCAMVGAWKREEAAGIPPAERSGWPDYKRVFKEACQ